MNRLSKILLVLVLGMPLIVFSQTPEELLNKEYPELSKLYAPKLEKQTAHYIFAIDVSNSMKDYASTVKNSCNEFINALADGDEVTIVLKAGTDKTDYLSDFKNIIINNRTKGKIISVIDNLNFDLVGSDGYKMTDKIIDAIIQTGGAKLVSVFMCTDFEYFTQKNGFNKNAEDWNALNTKLSGFKKDRTILATGLRLPFNVKTAAVYDNELKTIFDGIKFLSISDNASLSTMFADAKANMLAVKLKHIIYKELEALTIKPNLYYGSHTIESNFSSSISDFNLFSNFNLTLDKLGGNVEKYYFASKGETKSASNAVMCNLNAEYKPILPRWVNLNGNIEFSLVPNSLYHGELEKLGINLAEKTYKFSEPVPDKRVFMHILPLWVDAIIIVLLFSWIICFLFTKYRKITRSWTVNVSWKDNKGKSQDVSNVFKQKWFTVGYKETHENHLAVDGSQWRIKIETVSNCPCKLWIITGYYLTVEQGDLMELDYPFGFGNEPKILGYKSRYFLSEPRKYRGGEITILEGNVTYKVTIL